MDSSLDIYLFKKNGENILFDVPTFRLMKVDDHIFDFLAKYRSDMTGEVPADMKKIVDSLSVWQEEKSPDLERKLSALTMLVCQHCNMRCSYCYAVDGTYGAQESDQVMSADTAERALDTLVKFSGDSKVLSVCLFGGEPLLNFPLVKHIVTYGEKAARSAGKKMVFIVATNGTLMNKEVCDFINTHKIRPVISLDGDKELNDITRHYKDSHYDTVMNNLANFNRRIPHIIRLTLSKANFRHMDRIIDSFRKLGFRYLVFEDIVENNNRDLMFMTDDEWQALYDEYDRIYAKVAKEISWFNRMAIFPFTHTLVQINFPKKNYFECSAGRWSLAVDAKGDLFACHRMADNAKYQIANIHQELSLDNLEQYYGYDINSKTPCNKCWARYLCGGGCIHDADQKNDDFAKPGEDYCNHSKKIIELGLYHATKIPKRRLWSVVPPILKSLRASAGHHLKTSDWKNVEWIETSFLGKLL
jgi:uncharacterized protein